jgi:putative membrane protein
LGEQGGPYFGVPLRNYFGWVLTTFVIYWLAGAFWGNQKREKLATKTFASCIDTAENRASDHP